MSEDTRLRAPYSIREELESQVPELEPVLEECFAAIQSFVGYVHGMGKNFEGLSTVVNQAVNDLLDLAFDSVHGRGRAALRASRSLFELLVTTMDIIQSADFARRYERHRFVVAQIEAGMRFEADALPKKERSADLHRRRKLRRDTADEYEAAIAEYGSGYKSNWAAPRSLKTRAARHKLDRDYDFYVLASAVLHGSSGGELGLRSVVDGHVVHRQGPALSLCALAFLQGLKYFDGIVSACGVKRGGPSVPRVRAELAACLRLWPRYRAAIQRLDRELWPASAPLSVDAVCVVWLGRDAYSWVIHDPQTHQVCEIDPPALDHGRQTILSSILRTLNERGHDSGIVTIAFPGVPTTTSRGATWTSAPAGMPEVRHFTVGTDRRLYQHLSLPPPRRDDA